MATLKQQLPQIRDAINSTMAKPAPATPLPWTVHKQTKFGYEIRDARTKNVASRADKLNAAYIVHACNNYPRLVEALRDCSARLWHAMGGSDDAENKDRADKMCKGYNALLRELGEATNEKVLS